MVQPKRFLPRTGQEQGERPKRLNSGDVRTRQRRLASEDEEYTTDETSDEEEEDPSTLSSSPPPASSSRKSSKPPRRWQPVEDRRLAESVKQHGEANWKAIALKVGSRNHVQCLQRWKKVLRPGLVKGQWSAEEDTMLMKLATSKYKNWGVLSNHMPGRTSKQCRERWCHHLDPSINKGVYSPEEDRIIVETQARLGNKWSQIAARLPGRTENSIKIRCKALQRKGSSNSGGNGGSNGRRSGSNSPRLVKRSMGVSAPRTSRASSSTSATSNCSASSSCPSTSEGVYNQPPFDGDDEALGPGGLCHASFTPQQIYPIPPAENFEHLPHVRCSTHPRNTSGNDATQFGVSNPPFIQRKGGKGKALGLTLSSFHPGAGGVDRSEGDGMGGVASPLTSVSSPTSSYPLPATPLDAPAPPIVPMQCVADTKSYDWRWASYRSPPPADASATSCPPFAAANPGPAWPPSGAGGAGAGEFIKEEFTEQRLPLGGMVDYPAVVEPTSPAVGGGDCSGGDGGDSTGLNCTATSAMGSPISAPICGSSTHPPLCHFFEFGLNAIIGREEACVVQSSPLSDAGGAPAYMESGVTQAPSPGMTDATGGDVAFGAFHTLGIDDLKNIVGAADNTSVADGGGDAAAPLRSCCSFLDLPAEGIVGDMPLTW